MANPYYTTFTSHYLRFALKCPDATLFESDNDEKYFKITKNFIDNLGIGDKEIITEVFKANSKEVPYNRAVDYACIELGMDVNKVYRTAQLVQRNLAKEMGLI